MGLKDFEAELASRHGGIEEVGELYLDSGEAFELIKMARRHQLVILGIEGFLQKSGSSVADLSLIADFSGALAEPVDWHAFVDKTCHDAMVFLENNSKPAIRFSFVLGDEPID